MPYLKCDQCDFALWFQNDMLFYLDFLQCVLMTFHGGQLAHGCVEHDSDSQNNYVVSGDCIDPEFRDHIYELSCSDCADVVAFPSCSWVVGLRLLRGDVSARPALNSQTEAGRSLDSI